ncbi:protealysin inhibitor emfourin [Streptacidiphilus cavernicola]|uniref:Protealysin inhibitor emfourin n=1 Tax=Streptacidiphilus cavernicola TaxID=3342716 RepID=A0ABV6VRT9_9ACTN
MRIQVTRSGGILGAERRSVLDTEGRPDAPHIHALAREALGSCARTPDFGVPDGFHYAISVDDRSPGHCSDPKLTDSQKSLIALVMAQGQ